MNFGTRIRNAREDLDLTQKDMADQIPMNQSNYSKIERGIQEPSLSQLKRISEILRISIDELLGVNRSIYDEEKLKAFQHELDELYKKYFN